MRSRPSGLWMAVVVLAVARSGWALDPHRRITEYVHEAWRVEDGLPQGSIQAITQTRDGYLWIGTYEGLARFDGLRFTVFDKDNTSALTHNDVRALCEDPAGRLWIGTLNGLAVLERGGFRGVALPTGSDDRRLNSLLCDPEGAVWIGTRNGLLRLKDGAFTSYTVKNGLLADAVRGLLRDTEGALWIGTEGGLNRLRGGKMDAFTDRPLLGGITTLSEDREGTLWVGTSRGGLYRVPQKRFDRLTRVEGLPNERIWAFYEDRDGNRWVGTSSRGVMRLRDGRWEAFTTREGLSFEVVVGFYEDREGGLWIGTDGGGLNRFREGRAVTFTSREGLPNELVWAVLEDRRGDLWLGTAGGLVRYRDGGFTQFSAGLTNPRIHAIGEDGRGDLWVGTPGDGLFRFRDGRFNRYLPGRPGPASVNVLYPDPSGGLWIGSSKEGLSFLHDGVLRTYTTKDGLANDSVRSLLRDREGDLWIGTNGGLTRLRAGRFTSWTTRDGLPNDLVLDIHEDREGFLWIGTYGGGLARFEGGRFDAFDKRSGLLNDVIYRILEDDQGRLWLTSNKGIFSVSREDLKDFKAERIPTVPFVAYSASDGVRGVEVTGFTQPCGWKGRDGRLWFPMIKGLVMIDPAHLEKNTLPTPVVIEQAVVDSRPFPFEPSPRLPPGARAFEFEYTGLSLLEPAKLHFRYKLEGFDTHWVDAGTRRTAYYTNIPPGSYRFRVLAANADGIESTTDASLTFSLAPHFHQTVWFRGLCGVALLLAAAGAYRLRVAQLEGRQKALAQLVEERTRNLRESQGQLQQLNQDLEQRVRLSAAALAEKERMAAYGHMVGAVAHEVRNPIFALRSAIHVVAERLAAVPEMRGPLGTIEKVSERLSVLTDDLLEFGRPKTLAPTTRLHPRRLLEEVLDTYRTECPAAAPRLVTQCAEGLPEIDVDRHQMIQALLNLVRNAEHHALGVTTVSLSAAQAGAGEPGGVPHQVWLTVQDDGAGISQGNLPWIFEPFFTTENGTGLGLAIVRQIVHEHGGTVQAASSPGQGAIFTIRLPIGRAVAPATRPSRLRG